MDFSDAGLRVLGLIPPLRRMPIPQGPRDMASVLDKGLAAMPDGEALVGRHARFTYRALDAEVNAATAVLHSLGVAAGDRVAISVANHPDLVIGFLATQRLGALWVGLNSILSAP